MSPRRSPPQRRNLLSAAHQQPPERRALLLEIVARAIHPSVIMVAIYLLFAGLHHPGGGFAAGLVGGLAFVLRRLAGGPWELGAIARVSPNVLLGAGLITIAGYGLAAVVFSGEFLAGVGFSVELGFLGHLELTTSLIFEVGIALIVVGLVLDVLRTLGASQDPEPGGEPR